MTFHFATSDGTGIAPGVILPTSGRQLDTCTLTSVSRPVQLSGMRPSKQLQRIIKTCGMSRYEIAQRTGVSEAVLSRFVASDRAMNTDTLDKLGPLLGLQITSRPKPPRKGK